MCHRVMQYSTASRLDASVYETPQPQVGAQIGVIVFELLKMLLLLLNRISNKLG